MRKFIFCLLCVAVFKGAANAQTLVDWADPRVQNLYQEFKNDRTVTDMLNGCTALPQNALSLVDSSKAYYEDRQDGRVPSIYLPVYVNGEMIGILHWGKLAEGSGKTANGSKFVLAWRDYKTAIQYNPKPNGYIYCYDLNRGCQAFGRFVVQAGLVTDYIELTDVMHDGDKAHFCDLNQNGNVGWWECYRCMRNACNGSSTCQFLCETTNIAAGLIRRFWGGCSSGIAVSCVIIALAY